MKFSGLAAVLLMYSLVSPAYGQGGPAALSDRIHSKVKTAADAAGLIMEADSYRREADRLNNSGRTGEARIQRAAAGDLIIDAVSNNERLSSDPLLQDYLQELKT